MAQRASGDVTDALSSENRSGRRCRVEVSGMVHDTRGKPIVECALRNVSNGGAQIELTKEVALPVTFCLALSRDGAVRRQCRGVRQFATLVGVQFADVG